MCYHNDFLHVPLLARHRVVFFGKVLANGDELRLAFQEGVNHVGIEVAAGLFDDDRAGHVVIESFF